MGHLVQSHLNTHTDRAGEKAPEEENRTAGKGANEAAGAPRKEPLPWPGAFTSQGTRGPGTHQCQHTARLRDANEITWLRSDYPPRGLLIRLIAGCLPPTINASRHPSSISLPQPIPSPPAARCSGRCSSPAPSMPAPRWARSGPARPSPARFGSVRFG